MKVKQLTFLLLSTVFLIIFACRHDEPPTTGGKYSRGVFVVNEGPFGSGTGSITWYDPDTKQLEQDIFGKANGGAALGNVVQSLVFHGGRAFVVVNNAQKVVVADAETFVAEAEIKGFALPRHCLPLDDRYALVSQWGFDGLSGQLMKIDLSTLQIIDSVQVGHGPEKMYRLNDDEVWVANAGGYGVDSTISRVNWRTMTLLETRRAGGKNPCAFAATTLNPSQPFVLCKGDWNEPNPQGWVGSIAAANPTGVKISLTFSDDFVVGSGSTAGMFFGAGGSVYQFGGQVLKKMFDHPAYGLALDTESGHFYASDAKDFNSAGEVGIFDASGVKIGSFQTGVNPGEIVILK